MMTILSFLGGTAFRLIFGEIAAYFSKKQAHSQEVERMELQARLDADQHARNMASIKVQAELGIKTIQVQAEGAMNQVEADAWATAVADVGKKTGIKFLDIWNGSIRPALASLAMAMVVFEVVKNGFALTDWDRELVGGILGIYIADRHLSKRGK